MTLVKIAQLKMEKLLLLVTIAAEAVWIQTEKVMKKFQGCLSEIEVNGSPTEQQVQECMESSYEKMDSSEIAPMESTDGGDEDGNGVTEHVSAEDGEDREDGDSEQ